MLLRTARQPRHCRHTLVAFALTAVAEMMMPCTFTRRDTCSDCGGGDQMFRCDQMFDDNYENKIRKEVYRYLEATNGSVMGVTLQHHLDILDRLLPCRTGTGHFISYLLCSFLQL